MKKKLAFKIPFALTLAAATLSVGINPANATMSSFATFTGEGAGISIDAVAMKNPETKTVQVEVPQNAVINSAYLYSASIWGGSLFDVSLQGTHLTSNLSSRLDTGTKQGNVASENRWDVTSIVKSELGSGPLAGGTYNLNVKEHGTLDGEILAVTYSVAGGDLNTVMLFDGELTTAGDEFKIYLDTPFTTGDEAIMSLGISFSWQDPKQGTQRTEIDINGARLTSSAGGYDDGFFTVGNTHGGLITAGGVGDTTLNPLDPYVVNNSTGSRYDDELYNLAPYLSTGVDVIKINSKNPSSDDNVFFTALRLKGAAALTPFPEPSPVPESSSVVLLGLGLLCMAFVKREVSL